MLYYLKPFPYSHDLSRLFSHLLMFLGGLYCKQYGPRSGFSGFIVFASMIKSSLKYTWRHFHDKNILLGNVLTHILSIFICPEYTCISKGSLNTFSMEANTMNPDRTASKGTVWFRFMFAKQATKVHKLMSVQTTCVVNDGKMVYFLSIEYSSWLS